MRADGAWKPAEAVRDPRGPIWPSATSIQGFLHGLGRFEAGFDCACGGKGVALSSAAAGLWQIRGRRSSGYGQHVWARETGRRCFHPAGRSNSWHHRRPQKGFWAPVMRVTTISGRNRLWPNGLQYNARHMQITWPSISLCTGILAGRCSAICRRQLTKIRQEYAV